MMHRSGYIIALDKPVGISSNAASVQCRRHLHEKKSGYIGTLDPLATGVLPVFTGKMTKLIPYFEESYKIYAVVFELGKSSPSLDAGTEVSDVHLPPMDSDVIRSTIRQFVGVRSQVPPAYSAVKIAGVRAYKSAVKGISTKLPSRQIKIHGIDAIHIDFPFVGFTVKVSKGTYIRVLADEIAQKMGTRAVLTSLKRTAHGRFFSIDDTSSAERIKNADEKTKTNLYFKTIQYIVKNYRTFTISENNVRDIGDGKSIRMDLNEGNLSDDRSNPVFAMNADGMPVAAGYLEYGQDTRLLFNPHKVLL